MSNKVALLFTPPFPSKFTGMPIGLLQLATEFDRIGIETVICDLSSNDINPDKPEEWNEDVDDIFNEVKNEIIFIGISTSSPGLRDTIELAKYIKTKKHDAIIGVGGSHFYSIHDFWNDKRTEVLDFVVYGRHFHIKDFVNAIAKGIDLSTIPNLSIRKSDIGKKFPKQIMDYDVDTKHEMPFINFELLKDRRNYRYEGTAPRWASEENQVAQISTVLGCIFECRFCVSRSNGVIKYDLDSVLKRLDELTKQGVRFIFFDDPTFNLYCERNRLLLRKIKQLDIEWGCQSRIDLVDKSKLREMKEAGCTYIFYGVESGASKIKKYIGKEIPNSIIKNNVKMTKDLGIKVGISVIFGVPNESESSIQQTFKLINDIEVEMMLSPSFYAVYPGSRAEKDYQNERGKLNYIEGYSREKIWREFDDGYGACHYYPPEYAKQVFSRIKELEKGNKKITLI